MIHVKFDLNFVSFLSYQLDFDSRFESADFMSYIQSWI